MSDPPVTPRVCEACGGDKDDPAEPKAPCLWCTNGFQNLHQQRAWNRFRSRMKRISSTYNFVEETVHDLLRRLDAVGIGTDVLGLRAHELAVEGNRLLDARPTATDRRLATEELRAWHKASVDLLLEHEHAKAKAEAQTESQTLARITNRAPK